MKQPPDGLPISSPGISSRLSSPLASGGVATNSYHRTGLRRIEKPAAPPEKSLEFSAGLKTLDFPAEQQLYEHALDAAIELLQADAGVLATLEPDGTRLVVRAQRAGSLLGAHYHALAALGRSADSSLPPTPLRAEAQPLEFQKTQPLPMLPQPSDRDEAEIASKNGEAAPATPAAPPAGYARGQGLLGHIWETNRALALSGEKCRALPRDEMTPPDQVRLAHCRAPADAAGALAAAN